MSAAEIREQFEIASRGLRTIRDKNNNARKAFEQGNEAVVNEINQINDKIARIKELVGRSNQLDNALKAKEDELNNLKTEKNQLNDEFNGVKQERDNLQQQLRENQENLQNINATLVTNEEELRNKELAIEELQRERENNNQRLGEINADLQSLLADITQVNNEINETDGEVQQINQDNQQTLEQIKTLLRGVNASLDDVLNTPQPPASSMQQIHQDRMNRQAQRNDGLDEQGLGDMFNQDLAQNQMLHNERIARRQENANREGVQEGELNSLFQQPVEYIPDNTEYNEENSQPPSIPTRRPIYLTEWKNRLTPEEMDRYNSSTNPEEKYALEQEGRRRLAERKNNIGGRRRTTRHYRRHAQKNKTKKGGYIAVYNHKTSHRTKANSSKSNSKHTHRSSSKHSVNKTIKKH